MAGASRLEDMVDPPSGPARRPRQRFRRAAIAVVALLVSAALATLILHSPLLAVTEVQIRGLEHLSPDDVRERLALEGRNMLVLPVEEIISTLQSDPWVRRARLQRQLPGTIRITIEERRPSVVWQVGARQFSVDEDGTVLAEAGEGAGLPIVRDLDGMPPGIGDRVDEGTVSLVLQLARELPAELGQRPSSLEYTRDGGLVVTTDDGREARLGDGTDLRWKIAVWKGILEQAQASKLTARHIDLRFGDRPYFRP